MIDPLSVTLAVVAFATALKDIIETAQVIQDSFSKLPQNYRKARNLSEDVLKTLRGMEEIYQEHEDVFNKAKALRRAVIVLQVEMKSAHEECLRLIPPVSEKKKDRFKIAFYFFWSRDKVEALLLELKDKVDGCSQQFHLLSSLRTEALVFEIRDAVVQSFSSSSSSHNSSEGHTHSNMAILQSGLGSGVTNAQLFTFTQPNSMPMTWITDTIPTHELSKAYLRRELGKARSSLQSTLGLWSQKPPVLEIPSIVITWFLGQSATSTEVVHQDALTLTFRVQSLLQDIYNASWLRDADNRLNELVIALSALQMSDEAIAVASLRVDLWKAICVRYPSDKSSRQLARAFTSLAGQLSDLGNHNQVRSMSEGAVAIFSSLAASDSIVQVKRADVEFIAQNIMLQASIEPSPEIAIQLALDGWKVLQVAFGFNDAPFELDGTSTISSSDWDTIRSLHSGNMPDSAITEDQWFTFAHVLLRIAKVFNQYQEVVLKLARSALSTLNNLLSIHPRSGKVQDALVTALNLLTNVRVEEIEAEAIAEHLDYSAQHVMLLRQLVMINPQHYVLRLSNALWSQSNILDFIGRSDEAKQAYQEILDLRELAAAPPHVNLQIPSEIEGDYYAQLALYNYLAKRFPDAIYAIQNAISQYSALEFMDPGRSRIKHINALAMLCSSLSFTHQYEAILLEGHKAINMIDNVNLLNSSADLVESYRGILGSMMEALEAVSDTRTLSQAEDIVIRIQMLARSHKVVYESKSAQIPLKYARLLQKNGKIDEAIKYLLYIRVRNNWEREYGDLDGYSNIAAYIQCLMEVPSIFKGQGEIEKALRYNEEARTFMADSFGELSDAFVALVLRSLNSEYIILLCYVGRYPEAMEFSQAVVHAIDIGKDSIMNTDDITTIAQALHGHALAQLYNCMPDEAIATVTRALPICRMELPKDAGRYQSTLRILEYSCLFALSHCLHDLGNIPESLNHLNEAEKLVLELHSVGSIEELEATGDSLYETLLTKRSRLIFAQGEYEEAIKLIEKVQVIQEKKSKVDKSALQDFVYTLVYSAILYCVVGRHEEGLATAVRATELKGSIKVTSPAFARVIDIGLVFMMKRGAWRSVENAKKKLACTHQNAPHL